MKTALPLITFLAALAALHHLDSIDAKIHERPVTAFVASVLYERPLTVTAINASTALLLTITTFALGRTASSRSYSTDQPSCASGGWNHSFAPCGSAYG